MRHITLILIATFFTFTNSFSQFFSPESVAYDEASKRYFVSNFDGNNIVQIDQQGNVTDFVTVGGVQRFRGLKLVGSVLYVTNNDFIQGFDISTGMMVFNIQVANTFLLNDLESDGAGFLYASDMPNGSIVKIHIQSGAYWTYTSGIDFPNGILYDHPNNRFLICTFTTPTSSIHAVNISDSSVTTVIDLPFQHLDGITKDGNGNIYVSSWGSGTVYKFDPVFALPPDAVIQGLNGPADIFFNTVTDTLVVPVFNANEVIFMNMGMVNIVGGNEITPDGFILGQNFPNPFNPKTKIKFTVPASISSVNVSLKIFNATGQLIEVLVQGNVSSGSHEIIWNAAGMTSGVYFYRLEAGEFSQTKRMLLIK